MHLYWKLAGKGRGRTNEEGMRRTLERVKVAAEAEAARGRGRAQWLALTA